MMAGPWEKYQSTPAADGPWSKYATAPAAENTVAGVAGNFGAGTQRGIANALGLPVDAITGAINGIGGLTGAWGPIQNPIGGSESIYNALQPTRAGVEAPDTAWERGAGRVGEEVGASAIFAPALAARSLPALAVEGVSALGAGTGAAVAQEAAPGSTFAEVAGSLAGGLTGGMAASRALGVGNTAPIVRDGITEQRQIASQAYNGDVRGYTDTVRQNEVSGLATSLADRLFRDEGLDPTLHPAANAVMQRMLQNTDTPRTIDEMERLRRFAQRNVAGSVNPEEKRIGQIMVGEITDYIDNLSAGQMTGGTDPSIATDALQTGRMAHRRASAASTLQDATTRAQRRAASTGSGGNEINTTRQNIRQILDNPRKSRGFRPEELAAMEEVVMGTPSGNVARKLSRFAPTSGGLAAMLNLGGVAAAPQFALPIVAATEGAKYLGERSTRNSAQRLSDLIAPDRVLTPGDYEMQGLLTAIMMGRAFTNAGQ